jgi:MFS family permease
VRKHWMPFGVLFVVWSAFLLSFVDRLTWPPIIPLASRDLGFSAAQAGGYMTAFYIGYVMTQLPGGYLTDRFGYRRVLLISFLVMGTFTAAMGLVENYAVGFLLRILAGMGSGAVFSAGVRAIFDWFRQNSRATAMGFFMTASSLGVTVVNLFVPSVAHRFGWHTAFYTAGLFPLIGFWLALFLLKERTPKAEGNRVRRPFLQDLKRLLSNRNFLLLGLAGFFAMWATWGTATWANSYLNQGLHLSLVEAGYVMSLFGIASILCKPLIGILSDWIGGRHKALLILLLGLFGPILIAFGTNQSAPLIYPLAILLGIASYIYSPIMNTAVGESVDRELVGTATGLVNTIWQLGSLVSPVVVGTVIDATRNFFFGFLTLAAGPVLGTITLLFFKEKPASSR